MPKDTKTTQRFYTGQDVFRSEESGDSVGCIERRGFDQSSTAAAALRLCGPGCPRLPRRRSINATPPQSIVRASFRLPTTNTKGCFHRGLAAASTARPLTATTATVVPAWRARWPVHRRSRNTATTGSDSAPKIAINNTIKLIFKKLLSRHFANFKLQQFPSAVRQDCRRAYFLRKIIIRRYFSTGNGQPREPRRTRGANCIGTHFVPRTPRMLRPWPPPAAQLLQAAPSQPPACLRRRRRRRIRDAPVYRPRAHARNQPTDRPTDCHVTLFGLAAVIDRTTHALRLIT